ncbi:S8 family serine peptidase [Paraburkholderia sacchari]|uniref:S8 family serine peptidase n=1 Tax=Paraburkholderia sacchari TaxID=159450 RepID=A0A8T6ZAI5_9BURK|nr:S8 family serine peptidase [Paraburkholderia sacchari]NLP61786.1 S8 family serine peptidase [Paraburkholderia sacchari]
MNRRTNTKIHARPRFRKIDLQSLLSGRLSRYAVVSLFAALLAACGGGSNEDTQASGGSTPPKPDSLVQYEWHLKNTGQSTFSDRGGVPGIDLNVAPVFDRGETGEGVRVLVVDEGVDIRHPDLKDRIDSSMLHSFDPTVADANDPTPTQAQTPAPSTNLAHGTMVAGIIGASGIDGTGVRGVAPGIKLGGITYMCGKVGQADPCYVDANFANSFGGAPYSQNADVFNASFGSDGPAVQEFDPSSSAYAVVMKHLETLRNGKGALVVKAPGNSYSFFWEGVDCSQAIEAGVTCGNAALDPVNTMPQVVTVAAVNADGVKASYSTAGSTNLVSGLGGEFGYKVDDAISGPAILTTDLSGCNRGAVRTGEKSENPFNDPSTAIARELNPDCNYSATMNGTSAATPTVAGVIALMLHANPQLTWRDVRTILTATARRVDAARVAKTVTLQGGDKYVPEPAWTRNGAGRWFDNWYGFGLVDATAAVSMAKSYSTYLTGPMTVAGASAWSANCSVEGASLDTCGDSIALGKADGLTVAVQVGGNGVNTIEAVQLTVNLVGVSMRDIAVELISPAGTRSVLFNAFNGVKPGVANVWNLTLSSNAFNGESAHGVWKLRFVDTAQRANALPGYFQSVKLDVMGH